jgi:hypothetical protein
MSESFDLRPSPAKRLIVKIVAIVVLLAAAAAVVLILTSKRNSPACDHIESIRKTDPKAADLMSADIETYAMGHLERVNLSSGKRRMAIVEGDTIDERCRSAMGMLEDGLDSTAYANIVDCLKHVNDGKTARRCFPDSE